MKSKIIYSYTDKEKGICTVTIQNKYGKFTGSAYCHPDDMENFSVYAGERYAEIRANIKFVLFRYKQERLKLKTLQSLLKDIQDNCKNINDDSIKRIKIKIRDYSQSSEDWYNLYVHMKKVINKLDNERQEVLNKYAKGKEN